MHLTVHYSKIKILKGAQQLSIIHEVYAKASKIWPFMMRCLQTAKCLGISLLLFQCIYTQTQPHTLQLYLSMCFSISWAWEPHRGEWGPWASREVGDKGAPSISHWSLSDFLWSKKCRIEEGGQNEHQSYFSSILLWYHISHPIDINKNRCVISTASHWTKMKPNGSAVNHYIPPIL